ncbi:hypothetical protein HUT06_03665 [Actinomadura sp. NAK00032]|uniref:hypothetical protein n=1 Tax=Actinomadura sp. NAK00032 TaxID=2742128 RepID=UPI00158FF1B4|nr:hypothetical protein [Actinomadura sp. NAK00032]QKW33241.1 hypothetical protein HUT06_03665 [Actinomadura sp. NAK00032]
MLSVPIRRGAIRPQDRPRHALVPALLRLAAIAGLAIAGWIVLSALYGSADAAERPARQAPAQAGDPGYATVRHFTSRPGWDAMAEDAREVGDHPMRYVQSRRHDLFDDKDRAVRQVRRLADDAGVPRVRIPDVRPKRPVVKGLVHRVTDPRPAPRPAADAPPRPAERPDGHAASPHAAARKAPSAAGHTAAASGAPAHRVTDDCMGCLGDQESPAHAPVTPAPDAPSGGGSTSGHPLVPVADLPHRRGPAAPPAVDASTFHRTALTDVAAPGGPSVVPD